MSVITKAEKLEDLKDQMRWEIERYYATSDSYSHDYEKELAHSDLDDWSMRGTVPPLVWVALNEAARLHIKNQHYDLLSKKLGIVGFMCAFMVFFYFTLVFPVPWVILFFAFMITMMAFAYIEENGKPFALMKPPLSRHIDKIEARVARRRNELEPIKSQNGMLSLASDAQGGELTITETQGGLEIVTS